MNIDNRLNDPLFTPAPLAGAQPRQDNDQRERVAPAEQADAFAGQDERRERGNGEVALYDARGQKTGDEAATAPAQTGDASTEDGEDEPHTTEAGSRPTKPSGEPMSEAEVLELNDLKLRDQEVRTHEQQHAAVGGQHTGAPNYEFETGPDGKQYAVEGHVQVDMSPVADDPEATITKMQQIKAAALAPAEPSQADRSAAAQADQLIAEAQNELREQQQQNDAGEQRPASGSRPADEPSSATAGASTGASPRASLRSDDTSASPVMDNDARMQQRNAVIAGVYGRSAERQARALLGLA